MTVPIQPSSGNTTPTAFAANTDGVPTRESTPIEPGDHPNYPLYISSSLPEIPANSANNGEDDDNESSSDSGDTSNEEIDIVIPSSTPQVNLNPAPTSVSPWIAGVVYDQVPTGPLQFNHQLMSKKFYSVTVGSAVGVFSSVGVVDAVTSGVPGNSKTGHKHQQEAIDAFNVALVTPGAVRIVE